MAKKAPELVANNVNRLVTEAGLSNAALEKKTGGRLTRSTVDRVRRAQGSTGIESVSEIARAFGLELWQLCVADLDPNCPPVLNNPSPPGAAGLTQDENLLIARFRSISPAFRQLVLNDLDRYLEAERQTRDKNQPPEKHRA